MSDFAQKEFHSRRLYNTETKIAKQLEIASTANGFHSQYFKTISREPGRFAKHRVMDCGQKDCIKCGNPRRTLGEKTVQEKRFEQRERIANIQEE